MKFTIHFDDGMECNENHNFDLTLDEVNMLSDSKNLRDFTNKVSELLTKRFPLILEMDCDKSFEEKEDMYSLKKMYESFVRDYGDTKYEYYDESSELGEKGKNTFRIEKYHSDAELLIEFETTGLGLDCELPFFLREFRILSAVERMRKESEDQRYSDYFGWGD